MVRKLLKSLLGRINRCFGLQIISKTGFWLVKTGNIGFVSEPIT